MTFFLETLNIRSVLNRIRQCNKAPAISDRGFEI